MNTLVQDLRYGLRLLISKPAITCAAIIALALGAGASTAMFSVVNAVLLRPLEFKDPDQLAVLWERTAQHQDIPVSYMNFVDWRASAKSFSQLAAYRRDSFNLTGGDQPERPSGMMVTTNFFKTLGVEPTLGRDFTDAEENPGNAQVVILSYGYWQRRFGADPALIGKQITLNKQDFTVIGILPERYQFGASADIIVPIAAQAERFKLRGKDPRVNVVGRLAPGVTLAQARSEMNVIMAQLCAQYPDVNVVREVGAETLYEDTVGDVRLMLYILSGAVAFVMLIACANVANLLVARNSSRQQEVAVRLALGASRGRIIRQLLTESLVLATIGMVLGVLIATWGTNLLVGLSPVELPRLGEIKINLTVLCFTLLLTGLTTLLFGLAPALQATKVNPNEALKEKVRGSTRRRHFLRNGLVVAELALTLSLLTGTGLMIRSFNNLQKVDPGIDVSNTLVLQMNISAGPDEGPKVAGFLEQLQQRIGSLPGVRSFAFSNGFPLLGTNQMPFSVEGRAPFNPKTDRPALLYVISPKYFETLGIRLTKGRAFGPDDTRKRPLVAVVDQAFARSLFPQEDPIGKRLKFAVPDLEKLGYVEIVGVVAHVNAFELKEEKEPKPQCYVSFNQVPEELLPTRARRLNLAVRTLTDPVGLAPAIRREILTIDKDQPVYDVQTLAQIASRSIAPQQFSLVMLAIFSVVSLLLAAVGVYGVMANSVKQRTQEIGIRMSLGARGADIIKLFMAHGLKLTLLGVGIGLFLSVMLTQLLTSLLYEISPADPLTFTGVSLLLACVALLACYLPARRATKVEPVEALRYE